MENDTLTKAPTNFGGKLEQKFDRQLPLLLVIDLSSSMAEKLPGIEEGLARLVSEAQNDITARRRVAIGIVSFGSSTGLTMPIKNVSDADFCIPKLTADGSTPMKDGLQIALDHIKTYKQEAKDKGQHYFRPYVVLITDGFPDSDNDPRSLASDIIGAVNGRHLRFWAFGTPDADFEMLKSISHPEFMPVELSKADFVSFFNWLSNSMVVLSGVQPGETAEIDSQDESKQFRVHGD